MVVEVLVFRRHDGVLHHLRDVGRIEPDVRLEVLEDGDLVAVLVEHMRDVRLEDRLRLRERRRKRQEDQRRQDHGHTGERREDRDDRKRGDGAKGSEQHSPYFPLNRRSNLVTPG